MSGRAACFCAETLAAAAAEETADLLGFHRRGWRSLSVPSGRQPHCPLHAATRKPEGCPGSSDGARARQDAAARAEARQAAKGCRAPHAHQPLGWGASEAARGGRRLAASCSRAARARGWAWEAKARLAGGVRAHSPRRPPSPACRLGPGARHEGREGGEKGVGPQDRRGLSGCCEAPARAGRGRLRSRRRQRRREKMVALEVGAAGEELYSQTWHQRCR